MSIETKIEYQNRHKNDQFGLVSGIRYLPDGSNYLGVRNVGICLVQVTRLNRYLCRKWAGNYRENVTYVVQTRVVEANVYPFFLLQEIMGWNPESLWDRKKKWLLNSLPQLVWLESSTHRWENFTGGDSNSECLSILSLDYFG